LARWSDIYAPVLICVAFAGAIAFSSVRYRDFSPPLRITAFAIGMASSCSCYSIHWGPFAGPPNILRRSCGVKQASRHWFLEEIEAPEDTYRVEDTASGTRAQIDGETFRAVEQPEFGHLTCGQIDKCDHRH
jgi:hypothetical protein